MGQTLNVGFWGLHKNMNSAFPLKANTNSVYFSLLELSTLINIVFQEQSFIIALKQGIQISYGEVTQDKFASSQGVSQA